MAKRNDDLDGLDYVPGLGLWIMLRKLLRRGKDD